MFNWGSVCLVFTVYAINRIISNDYDWSELFKVFVLFSKVFFLARNNGFIYHDSLSLYVLQMCKSISICNLSIKLSTQSISKDELKFA